MGPGKAVFLYKPVVFRVHVKVYKRLPSVIWAGRHLFSAIVISSALQTEKSAMVGQIL